MRKAVILTAIPLERKALWAYLPQRDEVEHPRSGTLYDHGFFQTAKGRWDVSIVEMGMGDVSAAHMAQQAIDFISPDLLFFVGVAGGLKDVEPGDVVAATKIYEYESGKSAEHFYPRAEIGLSAHRLVQRAKSVIAHEKWQQRIKGTQPEKLPKAVVGAIAAGGQVLASTASPTWKFLKEYYGDALAVEMEGYGVLAAARANQTVEAIVIRGISDTIDNKKNMDKLGYQDIAARHASAFAFEMLAQMDPQDDSQGRSVSSPTVASSSPVNSSPNTVEPTTPVATLSGSVRIFYSYMTRDQSLIDDLKAQLTVQRRAKKIQEWDTSLILAGEDRQKQIDRHLQQDDIFILGISSAYVNSDEHYAEMMEALKQRARRSAIVIPVLLRSVDISELPIKELLLLPRSKTPVNETANREKVLEEIAGEIKKVVNERLGIK
jgi:nucleoside phosphorylase